MIHKRNINFTTETSLRAVVPLKMAQFTIVVPNCSQSFETKKKGVGKVEEKQAVLHEEGKMDDGLDFSRSQEEESRTARVIRKCSSLFHKFIRFAMIVICSDSG